MTVTRRGAGAGESCSRSRRPDVLSSKTTSSNSFLCLVQWGEVLSPAANHSIPRPSLRADRAVKSLACSLPDSSSLRSLHRRGGRQCPGWRETALQSTGESHNKPQVSEYVVTSGSVEFCGDDGALTRSSDDLEYGSFIQRRNSTGSRDSRTSAEKRGEKIINSLERSVKNSSIGRDAFFVCF